MLKINEIFASIQGEGGRSGHWSIFIRLSGCNLNCTFCDTNHESFIKMSEIEILNKIKKHAGNWIVITGGEPLTQDIRYLCQLLKENNYKIAIETNGTNSLQGIKFDWVTVSPKQLWLHGDFTDENLTEIKIIVESANEIKTWNLCTEMYLQPEGNKEENIKRCLQIIEKEPRWKLSLQIHKILKIK